jgi:hypothetical protein
MVPDQPRLKKKLSRLHPDRKKRQGEWFAHVIPEIVGSSK